MNVLRLLCSRGLSIRRLSSRAFPSLGLSFLFGSALTASPAPPLRSLLVSPAGLRPPLQDQAAPLDEPRAARPSSPVERRASWARHLQMEAGSPYRALQWQAVGPRQQGGRIESIAIHPDHPNTIYVGPGSGNLWRSVDGGLRWTPIFEQESSFAIGDVVIAPSDPDVLWLGTGETPPRHSGYAYAGTGVFRSTDAGASWTHVGLDDSHHIGAIAVHPSDPGCAYVAAMGHYWSDNAQRGVLRTRDGGQSWQHVLALDEKTGAIDVLVDFEQPDTVFAWMWGRENGARGGLYRSGDGGDSWRAIRDGLPTGPTGRAGLAQSASQPEVLYLFLDDRRPSEDPDARAKGKSVGASLYRSDDRGQSFFKTHEQDLYPVFTEYGWKFCDVRVSPTDPDEVYICGNRLYHSTDGGGHFERVGEDILRLHDTQGRVLHLDHHDLWIDPADPAHLVLGNDGGLFVSRDRGGSWLHHNNLPIGEFYFVHATPGTPLTIYGGTQDNAALYGPASPIEPFASDPWEHVYLDPWTGGDAFVTLPDPTQDGIVYYQHQHGSMHRMDLRQGNILSGGPATQRITPRAPKDAPRWRFSWSTPYLISHHDPQTLYVGGNVVARSRDRGDSWTAISPDLADPPADSPWARVPSGTITTLDESVHRPGLLIVGTEGGKVWLTEDEGGTWTPRHEGLPPQWVSRVVLSPTEPRRAHVALHAYRQDDFRAFLYTSDDLGLHWRPIHAGLPDQSIHVVREDPRHPGHLYVGTDGGVYLSTDGGASWHSLAATLPTTPVHDLALHDASSTLVAGTHGRSVFVLDVSTIRGAEVGDTGD